MGYVDIFITRLPKGCHLRCKLLEMDLMTDQSMYQKFMNKEQKGGEFSDFLKTRYFNPVKGEALNLIL